MSTKVTAISSAGVPLNFVSSVDLYDRYEGLVPMSYIPEMQVLGRMFVGNYSLTYLESSEGTIEYEKDHVVVKYPWEVTNEGEMLLYAGYPLIELQRQNQGALTMHAAAVQMSKGGALFLGKEGSGKSSLALHLCMSHRARLIANDLCVLGESGGAIKSYGGTKFFFLRYESVKRSLPHLLHFFPTIPLEPWLGKVKILVDQLGIVPAPNSVQITRVYLVHIDETKTEVFVSSADTLVNRLYLYENFSRYIRSTCTALLSNPGLKFLGYVPSLDTPDLYALRVRIIDNLLVNMSAQYVSGPLEAVADYVASSTTDEAKSVRP